MMNKANYKIIALNFRYLSLIMTIFLCFFVIMFMQLNYSDYTSLFLFYFSEFTFTYVLIPISIIFYYLNNRFWLNGYMLVRHKKNYYHKRMAAILLECVCVTLIYNIIFYIIQFILLRSVNFDYMILNVLIISIYLFIINASLFALKFICANEMVNFIIMMVICIIDFCGIQSFIYYELDIFLKTMLLTRHLMFDYPISTFYVIAFTILKIVFVILSGYVMSKNWGGVYDKKYAD